jgi:4-hydroxybenzoate polyprenyltransferase
MNRSASLPLIWPRALNYGRLMRLDRPVGTLLLLWPTLAALWLAAGGLPPTPLLVIFVLGTLVMRAAGCVINDFADREFDGHVRRTKERPLAAGRVSDKEALALFAALLLIALGLVLLLNVLTQRMALLGAALAVLYPFMKRFTYLPQVVLGLAFSWGIIMAFTAVLDGKGSLTELPQTAWLLFVASVLWIVAYDTLYAMVDRSDDLKVGIKSTAILFGSADRLMVGSLQAITLLSFILLGTHLGFGFAYHASMAAVALLFGYQQYLIRNRDADGCFRAFGSNVWVGFALFAGVVLELSILPAISGRMAG